jgi:hypothetical protein
MAEVGPSIGKLNVATTAQSGPAPRDGPGCSERRPPPRYEDGGVVNPTFCIRSSSVGLIVEPTTFFCIR